MIVSWSVYNPKEGLFDYNLMYSICGRSIHKRDNKRTSTLAQQQIFRKRREFLKEANKKEFFNRSERFKELLLLNHRVFNLTKTNTLRGLNVSEFSQQQIENYIWYLNFELSFYTKELGVSLK